MHGQKALHLEVLSVHALRTTHDTTHLHPIRILLDLVLILLLLLDLSHVDHSILIKILWVLLRLNCGHPIDSILKPIIHCLWLTNLCLIIPILIDHWVVALSCKHLIFLPVLSSLKIWWIWVSTAHLTVEMWCHRNYLIVCGRGPTYFVHCGKLDWIWVTKNPPDVTLVVNVLLNDLRGHQYTPFSD